MSKKREVTVTFIPVEGDVLETIIDAIAPNIQRVLDKHGATIKCGVRNMLRKHAKPHPSDD
ncbi:hypothetical protein [Paenibacillus sinopodophylli]|uniref:hypothetical protein n=1 Tax=Paenibacillus sinopodophylli TaxID=1837342 RepID=UPI00110CD876|nr:hypothetical protein [Paenibacillus sinopodophylli]